jgi:alpha-beta hydrolase superfamily lysophospholipase
MRTWQQRLLNLSSYPGYSEQLVESAGVKIALSLYTVSADAPCVVFLPGTMTHPLFYDEFLTALAESGFNVVGVHFLSHGKSPRSRRVFSFDDLVENAKDAIDYAKRSFCGAVVLMGTSQGGIVSMAAASGEKRISAVFAHDAILPDMKETASITRFPRWTHRFYRLIPKLMRLGARRFPGLQIQITAYLDLERVTASEALIAQFNADPIGRRSYPLSFLASLFSADLSAMTDGTIGCPVVVIASKEDRLFDYRYICRVFEKIVAPQKELLAFDEGTHLLFVESAQEALGPVAARVRKYTAQEKAAGAMQEESGL